MTLAEAIELIGPAVPRRGGAWADFGAGTGLFTRALASVLGPDARLIAVDRDARALTTLHEAVRRAPLPATAILTVPGDFREMDSLPELASVELDGALFANSLHFVPDAERVLFLAARRLTGDGRVVVIEYDGRAASRWIPYPVSLKRLEQLTARTTLRSPQVVGTRPSTYGGILYCAVLERVQS